MEEKEREKRKKQFIQSMIRQYSNGYTAHWIDKHPNGTIFRDINNNIGVTAFPEETIVVVNLGTVVSFLEDIAALDRWDQEMHLTIKPIVN